MFSPISLPSLQAWIPRRKKIRQGSAIYGEGLKYNWKSSHWKCGSCKEAYFLCVEKKDPLFWMTRTLPLSWITELNLCSDMWRDSSPDDPFAPVRRFRPPNQWGNPWWPVNTCHSVPVCSVLSDRDEVPQGVILSKQSVLSKLLATPRTSATFLATQTWWSPRAIWRSKTTTLIVIFNKIICQLLVYKSHEWNKKK